MKLATSGFQFDSATNRLTDSGYDQAGNMTSFLTGAMTYDANNREIGDRQAIVVISPQRSCRAKRVW